MSHTPNFDAKVKSILDATKPGERVCALTGEKWYMDEREIGWYRKFNVPPSKYSPLSRMKLINAYFVLFDIWYNKHADTGKPIITNIHPATGIRVLPDEEWFARDFSETSQELDLKVQFLDQLYKLSRSVPRAAGYNPIKPERSIAFISFGDEDSYFVLACRSKRSFCCITAFDVEDCAELDGVQTAQESYNVIHSDRIFRCKFVRESYDCINSAFLFDCRNCEFCFGATNQRNKKYLFFNEQLSKKEWERRVSAVDLTSYGIREQYERRFRELIGRAIWPENFNVNSPECRGEYLTDCVNVQNAYFVHGGRDLEYANYCFGSCHDVYLASGVVDGSDCYYGLGFHHSSRNKFALSINQNCLDTELCESCYDCTYCFGCVGLRKKSYCILNKQYTEEEYWKRLDELKYAMLEHGEYGELAPAYFSTQYGLGSGTALVYGATDEEARQLHVPLFDPAAEGAEGPEIDPALIRSIEQIPDRLTPENEETLTGIPFRDPQMGRRFSYLRAELALYRRLGIAPPRLHPTARIHALYREMNAPIFSEKTCDRCGNSVTVATNRAYPNRTIYCRPCYLRYLEERG